MATVEELVAIEKSVKNQELAIEERGFGTVFRRYRDVFLNATSTPGEQQSAEVLLVKRALMSSSFIAASFQLEGQRALRDKAAQSCALMLSAIGHDPMELFKEHLRCEQAWLLTLKQEGIRPNRTGLIAVGAVVVLIVAVILALWLFR